MRSSCMGRFDPRLPRTRPAADAQSVNNEPTAARNSLLTLFAAALVAVCSLACGLFADDVQATKVDQERSLDPAESTLLATATRDVQQRADSPNLSKFLEDFHDPADSLTASAGDAKWPPTWNLAPDVTFRLRGRIDTDAIWSSQSAKNTAIFGDLADVVGLRRARIGAEGQIGPDRRYITEVDLASGNVVPRDIFVGLGDTRDSGERRIGHFREPFSLEGGTSANTFAFLERAPINVLDPGRNWGLGLFRCSPSENATLAMGVFHAGTDAGGLQGGDGSTVGFTGRLTAAPVNEGNGQRLLHLGIALSERLPENGVILINQQPRSPLLDLGDSSTTPFVPAIRIPAKFQQLINLQLALANGPFWTQAEWYGSFIDQRVGSLVFFHGCHADCGYFISGEHREYLGQGGVFGPVRVGRPVIRGPAGRGRELGWGAWELTARFAYLDFFDPNTPLGPAGQLVGIRLPQSTFGVNWYLADHLRIMLNYSYAMPDEPNTGTSAANIFATRLAMFW
jgi:phosphate-selective porin OprO and OprP